MRIPFLFLSAAMALLRAQHNYYLPQAADGGGLRSTVVIVNTSTSPANITISDSRDDGIAATISLLATVQLAPGASRLFMTDGSGDGSLSAIVVGSDVAVSAGGYLSNVDASGNVLAESWAPVVSSDQLATEYMAAIDTSGALNSAVALYNPSSNAIAVTLALFDTAGVSQGSATVTVGPGGHAMRFIKGDLFPAIADFQGSLDVAAGGVKIAAAVVRQRAGSVALTLLSAQNRVARQVRFLFPQVYDGPAPEGTLRTTFMLTNLSSVNSASPSIAFTHEDGTSFHLTGFDPTQPIPPGGSAYWQTDGASASLALGAAAIRSDQPLAVSAIVTAYDANGNVLSESALTASTQNYQFLIPFDQSTGMSAGAAFYNSGGQPLTLTMTLLDPDGTQLATAQSNPIPSLGRLSGAIQDFFPGAPVAAGSVLVSTGTPLNLSLAAFDLRQGATTRSSAPAVRVPVVATAKASTVTPKLDSAHVASADISTSGGTLSVTDAKGNKFTLTLPPGALTDRETIKMSAIASATGVSGSGLFAGVQLEPDGLALMQPATLRIDLASAAPADALPIGWRGSAPGLYLNPPTSDTKSLTVALTHFSGAGVGGFDLTNDLLAIANQLDLMNSAAAFWAAQARQAGDAATVAIDNQQLLDTFDIGIDMVIEPMIELALSSDDEDVMRCAITIAIGTIREMELLGFGNDPRVAALTDLIQYCFGRMASKVQARCQGHDITAYFDIFGALRQAELLGLQVTLDPNACVPALELDFKSEIKGDIPIGVTGTFDATISAKVILSGGFTKDALTQVTNPAFDLFTGFTLAGANAESYDTMTLVVNNVPAGCTETISAKTPATLTVKQGTGAQVSQALFVFDSHYDPQAVTANGQQLCSFCPVYRKTPIKVGLWLDPGKPSETIASTCQGVTLTTPMTAWWAGWSTNHATDLGFIENWNLVNNSTLFASKTINSSITGPGGIKLTEITDLQLKPYSGH